MKFVLSVCSFWSFLRLSTHVRSFTTSAPISRVEPTKPGYSNMFATAVTCAVTSDAPVIGSNPVTTDLGEQCLVDAIGMTGYGEILQACTPIIIRNELSAKNLHYLLF